MKTMIVAGCVLGFASASAAAAPLVIEGHRAPAEEFVTEQVSFADLDISNQAGLGTLRGRIHEAANRVCDSTNPDRLMASVESLGCYRHAVSDSYRQIDNILAARGTGAVIAATVSVSAH